MFFAVFHDHPLELGFLYLGRGKAMFQRQMISANKTLVKEHGFQHVLLKGASAGQNPMAQFTSDDDNRDILSVRQLHSNVQPCGSDHEIPFFAASDQAGQLDCGGAAPQKDSVTVRDTVVGSPCNGKLFRQADRGPSPTGRRNGSFLRQAASAAGQRLQ